jgi:hypothetical protein
MKMINNPMVVDPNSKIGKQFRRRFRIPFPVFQFLCLVAKEKKLFGVGESDASGRSSVPIELKLLGALRILGRGWCFGDVAEATGMSEETACTSFLKFCTNFVQYECN